MFDCWPYFSNECNLYFLIVGSTSAEQWFLGITSDSLFLNLVCNLLLHFYVISQNRGNKV